MELETSEQELTSEEQTPLLTEGNEEEKAKVVQKPRRRRIIKKTFSKRNSPVSFFSRLWCSPFGLHHFCIYADFMPCDSRISCMISKISCSVGTSIIPAPVK